MLAPRWHQLKIGPLLRGERDLRTYRGLFRSTPEQITGLKRVYLELTAERISEYAPSAAENGGRRALLREFAGMEGHFRALRGSEHVIRRELIRATRSKWVDLASRSDLPTIGIHVRAGDFAIAQSDSDFRHRGAVRTPLSWFVMVLGALRAQSPGLTAFVVSDATDRALAPLLSLDGMARVDTGSAIGDLLTLSRARVLLGSGGSSFSAWAAYLGETPVITIDGQSLEWFELGRPDLVTTAADETEARTFATKVLPALVDRPNGTWWDGMTARECEA
jgi:hypothetical protein